MILTSKIIVHPEYIQSGIIIQTRALIKGARAMKRNPEFRIQKPGKSLGLIILVAFLLISIGISQHYVLAQAPVRGGTLIEVLSNNPPALEAWTVTGVEVSAISEKIFNKLVNFSLLEPRGYEIVPELAESFEVSPDGTVFTFHLHDNVRWHDGESFTSADVKYTFEVLLAKYYPRAATLLPNFVGVDAPDDYTVVFTFSKPNPSFLIQLAGATYIMPTHIYDDPNYPDPTNNPANMNPIGTGPFKIGEFVEGDHLTLIRNDDYWKKDLPYLDRIIFRIILDPVAALNAFEAGEVDTLSYNQLQPSEIGRLEQMPGISMTTRGGETDGQIMFVGMNFDANRITSNRLVREALWRAIDREDLVQRIEFGNGRPAYSVIMSGNPFYAPEFDNNPFPYDVDMANALLDQAGYPRDADGTRFHLTNVFTTNWTMNKLVSDVLTQSFLKIGVVVDNVGLDMPAFSDRAFTKRDFDILVQFYGVEPDPAVLVSRLYITATIGKAWSNAWGYSNSKVDDLFAQAASTFDTATRLQAYQEVQRVLIKEDVAILPLYEIVIPTAYQSKLQNFVTGRIAFASRDAVWIASAEQPTPTAEQMAPTVEQAAPTIEQAKPTVEQAATTVEQAAPVVEQAAPSTTANWVFPVVGVIIVVGAIAATYIIIRRKPK